MINNQPPSASTSPRFCNMGTFMRLPRAEEAKDLDVAILGVPLIQGLHLEQVQDLAQMELERFLQ